MRTHNVVLILLAAVVALVAALGGYQLFQSRAAVERELGLSARSGAQVVSANIEWVMETARQVLTRVDDVVADPEDSLPRDAAGKLAEAVASIPGAPQLYVVDAAGQTLMTTYPQYKPADITDREYFIKAKEGEPYWVSSLLVSRQNGDQIFTISKRMERNGRFAGVIILSLNSGLLEKVWQGLSLDPQSTVGLFRDDGWMVSRFPLPSGPQDLSKYVLFTEYLPASPEGTYNTVSPTDGVNRLVAYKRVPGTNLVAISSLAVEPAMQAFATDIAAGLVVGIGVIVLLLLAVGWIAKLLRQDEKQQRALAQAAGHNNLLLAEIHHRVKNHLAGVIGLINVSNIVPEEKKQLADRIHAMVSAYSSTYEHGDQFDALDASKYIPRIVDDLAAGYGRPVEVSYDLEPVMVGADRAMALALLVNEVVTNAFKYAFPGEMAGRLDIRLKSEGDMATLTVRDNGHGFDPEQVHKGTGTRLVRGFAQQLQGENTIVNDGGTVFSLTFRPMSSEQTASRP